MRSRGGEVVCAHLEYVDPPLAVYIQHVERRLQIVQQRAEHLVQTKNGYRSEMCTIFVCVSIIQVSEGGECTQKAIYTPHHYGHGC